MLDYPPILCYTLNGGLYKYTFQNICVENKEIRLKDDATKIFLNPNGTGPISKELAEFFEYLREHKASGEFSQALDQSVSNARHNALWRKEYMTVQQEILIARSEAREEALEEGRVEREALEAENKALRQKLKLLESQIKNK